MKRGELVTVIAPGAYGKPRPALVIQSDLFGHHPSITICLLTTHLHETPLFRYTIEPNDFNGLQSTSQIQIDKIMTVPCDRVGATIGLLSDSQMTEITRLLALWIGIADR